MSGNHWGFRRFMTAGFLLAVFFILVIPCRGDDSQVPVMPKSVRVGLLQGVQSQQFSVRGEFRAVDRQTGQSLAAVLPGDRWEVRYSGGRLQFFKNGQPSFSTGSVVALQPVIRTVSVLGGGGVIKKVALGDSLTVIGAGSSVSNLNIGENVSIVSGSGVTNFKGGGSPGLNLVTLAITGRTHNYRGDMEFRVQGQGITVINELSLEEYLYGVLPREMPSSWPLEAQKAQAVASRTYAVANLGIYRSYGFDLLATEMSQMYGGYDAETPNSTRAVNETAGEAIIYRGKPISAYFHSSSGGFTENAQDVWRDSLDYIKSKPDPYDKNDKQYNWVVNYSQQMLVDQLNSKKSLFNTQGSADKCFSRVDGIDILEKTSSGVRAKKIRVSGLGGDGKPLAVEISNADAVRMALGLKSALFTIKKQTDTSGKLVAVTFTGSGYGHGLGMSQYGACGMASQGYNYRNILLYYYSNCGIEPLSGVE